MSGFVPSGDLTLVKYNHTRISSGKCQDINCRLPCCWWIYRRSFALLAQISFISSCSAADLGHKMHLYLRRITSGCCHCVDTVHLPFIVSGRKKKSIPRGGHLPEDLMPFQSEESLWAVSAKHIFTISTLKPLETITYGSITSCERCRVINAKGLNKPFSIQPHSQVDNGCHP